jgi:aminoglycoside phosphotransferase (APT) family kinase protein
MERLISWVKERQKEVRETTITLVHGDYRLDNLIFSELDHSVVGILDWELATLGDPITDLGYLAMCLRLPKLGGLVGLHGKDRRALGLITEEQILELYSDRRGLSRIDNWDFYLAFSFFRFASICQGVFRRSLDGNASNSSAAENGNLTGQVAAMAAELIEKPGS